jgi:hypothetical protein
VSFIQVSYHNLYEIYCLLDFNVVHYGENPTFRTKISPQSYKSNPRKKSIEADCKLSLLLLVSGLGWFDPEAGSDMFIGKGLSGTTRRYNPDDVLFIVTAVETSNPMKICTH